MILSRSRDGLVVTTSYERWERPLWLALSLIGVLAIYGLTIAPHGFDFYAYWAVDPLEPYAIRDPDGYGEFRYMPPVALLFAPLGLLPLQVAELVWLGLQFACLWYIAGRWAIALVAFPPVFQDLAYGNIAVMLGAMIVAGYRHPGAWTFGLLTKVTTGVGVVWFAVRREWWALGRIGLAMAAFFGISLLVQGLDVWTEWWAMLRDRSGFEVTNEYLAPIYVRLPTAVVLVAWGAWTDRRWTMPLGVVLAMPTLWLWGFAPLVAWFRSR